MMLTAYPAVVSPPSAFTKKLNIKKPPSSSIEDKGDSKIPYKRIPTLALSKSGYRSGRCQPTLSPLPCKLPCHQSYVIYIVHNKRVF